MSLLEDIFPHDEANEAHELERIIEGDEFNERPDRSDSDDNSEKEDEAEEEKQRVDPQTVKTKRIIKNPRFILNPARLTGPRGIHIIPDHFKDFKFKGKGHEKEDLDLVLKKLEHWAYRLYPKFKFGDCLNKIETLGKKRPVMVHLTKIRTDQYLSEETVVQKDSSDDEIDTAAPEEDEFDRLLQQQIELARSTPAHNSVQKPVNNPEYSVYDMSQNASSKTATPLSDEQKEKILKSRRLAEEKRLARLQNATNSINYISQQVNIDLKNSHNNSKDINDPVVDTFDKANELDASKKDDNMVNEPVEVDIHSTKNNTLKKINKNMNVIDSSDEEDMNDSINKNNGKKVTGEIKNTSKNRSNVIDSSEEEDIVMNESVTVDIHRTVNMDDFSENSNKTLKNTANVNIICNGSNFIDKECISNINANNSICVDNVRSVISVNGNPTVCLSNKMNNDNTYIEDKASDNIQKTSSLNDENIVKHKYDKIYKSIDENCMVNIAADNVNIDIMTGINNYDSNSIAKSNGNIETEHSSVSGDITENIINDNCDNGGSKNIIETRENTNLVDIDRELMDVDFDEEF